MKGYDCPYSSSGSFQEGSSKSLVIQRAPLLKHCFGEDVTKYSIQCFHLERGFKLHVNVRIYNTWDLS